MSAEVSPRQWPCPNCDYVYDEAAGDPREGFAPGTPFAELPDDWACPDCAVRDKLDFTEAGERVNDEADA